MITFKCYPGGVRNVLTMSYDDGRIEDRRLVEIFNRYGIRGTFHLNSSLLGNDGYIGADEVKTLYRGHEVSCHSLTHPHLTCMPASAIVDELKKDRENLEALSGGFVRGMSYPFGVYDENVLHTAELCGLRYSRTTASTMGFGFPENFLTWHPSCHHGSCLELAERFAPNFAKHRTYLFYVWGHSYEFTMHNNWDLIETFCERVSGLRDVWYATNIEIYDYMMAQRSLIFSADMKQIYNPTMLDVWIDVDYEPVKIPHGETINL